MSRKISFCDNLGCLSRSENGVREVSFHKVGIMSGQELRQPLMNHRFNPLVEFLDAILFVEYILD